MPNTADRSAGSGGSAYTPAAASSDSFALTRRRAAMRGSTCPLSCSKPMDGVLPTRGVCRLVWRKNASNRTPGVIDSGPRSIPRMAYGATSSTPAVHESLLVSPPGGWPKTETSPSRGGMRSEPLRSTCALDPSTSAPMLRLTASDRRVRYEPRSP